MIGGFNASYMSNLKPSNSPNTLRFDTSKTARYRREPKANLRYLEQIRVTYSTTKTKTALDYHSEGLENMPESSTLLRVLGPSIAPQ